MSKKRLDQIIFEKGFADSREKAKKLIMEGIVYVNNQKEDKPGSQFDEEADFEVRGNVMPYVSRGGFKLEKAMNTFNLNVSGKVCGDIGSSTGGFTDCMLQNGAKKVYAIDVGRGQLDWKLRQDERVVSMEKTNIRYVTKDDLKECFEFASIDVSFISLSKVLPVVYNLLSEDGEVCALIKPQFEAGRDKVGKGGVVRDIKTHYDVINQVFEFTSENQFFIEGLTYSPIKGPNGNIEYLMYLKKQSETKPNIDVNKIVDEAFENL